MGYLCIRKYPDEVKYVHTSYKYAAPQHKAPSDWYVYSYGSTTVGLVVAADAAAASRPPSGPLRGTPTGVAMQNTSHNRPPSP